jgi:hypothetical protein
LIETFKILTYIDLKLNVFKAKKKKKKKFYPFLKLLLLLVELEKEFAIIWYFSSGENVP